MNPEFREELYRLLSVDASTHYYGKKQDFRQILAFGVFAEVGENHYLFIYRDPYEKDVTYEAIIFFYRSFDFKKPFHIVMTNPEYNEYRKDIFVQAAVYFLKNGLQNTMAPTGKIKELYDKARDIIADNDKQEAAKKSQIENYDFNVLNQEIQESKVRLRSADKWYYSSYMREQLKILNEKQRSEPEREKPSKGRLGLCLVLTEGGSRMPRFKPIIIPIKRDGTLGTAKPATPSQLDRYDLQETPEILQEFLQHLQRIHIKRYKDPGRMEEVNRIYYEKLILLLMEMPDDLTYCQFEYSSDAFCPLKKIKFKKMEVKFAPLSDGERLSLFLVLTGCDGQVYRAGLNYRVIIISENQVYLFFTSPQTTYYFTVPEEPEKFHLFFRFLEKGRKFSVNDYNMVKKGLKIVESDCLEVQPAPMERYRLKFRPIPILKILKRDPSLDQEKRIEIEFDYDSEIESFLKNNPHKQLIDVEKNEEFETMCFRLLKTDPLLKMKPMYYYWDRQVRGYYFSFNNDDELTWLVERGMFYLEKGFKIYSEKRKQYINYTGTHLYIDIRAGIKWLEFKPQVCDDATGETFEIENVDLHNEMIKDKKGNYHLVKRQEIEKLDKLFKYAEQHGNLFRVPAGNYFLINTLYDQRMEEIPQIKEKLVSFERLESFDKIPNYKLADNFKGELRQYQKAGFCWLHFLNEYNLPGCLADDMGLGKTVQTLALLLTLKKEKQLKTSLLVVPVSAIPVWETEIEKFTPSITIYRHIGLNRQKDCKLWTDHDLVVTSYSTLRNDIEIFKEFQFYYIVLDESQNIKNLSSQISRAVKILKSHHRLALSGTPIENNSLELWSLFDFLMPGFLGTRQWFKKEWAIPVEKYKDQARTALLRKMVYPFLLRRKKEDVEKELPEKTEIVESLQMDEQQLQLYAHTARYYRQEINEEIEAKGLSRSSFKILEGMLRLRQICLFPRLVDNKYKDIPSIKFDHFRGMLDDILAEGHKVLVFSQFVKVLTTIKEYFSSQKINYSYIDGSVPVKIRGKMIKTFQEQDDIGVFLLSLKAGGVSLNLTAADYVIIFDPWWNPAVEAQAIDRSHRIGQTKKVIVYRMVVKDSIEEKMLTLQDQKRELVEKLITSETRAFKNLTKDDIMQLFS